MKKEKLECPKCESKNILTRIDQSRFCRRCGHEWKAGENE